MRFCFGIPNDPYKHVIIEAKNLEHAIKIFKVSELFPEKCVDKTYWKRDEDGYWDHDHDQELGRDIYKFKIDNPKIFIYDATDDHDWKKISQIGLKECIEVDFTTILPKTNLLEAPKIEQKTTTPQETLPVISNEKAVSQITQKTVLREKHDALARMKHKYELLMREAERAMNVLRKELQQKQKVVYILETFMGIHEEIVQIHEGIPAPEGTPLSLYQQKLYMDEEVGIWDNASGQGIDFQEIEKFDEWIVNHFKTFAPQPLSVVAWQVRRNDKEYGNVWKNVQFNQWNQVTYFLIRNGDRLYRIWSNVHISDRMFPKREEFQNVLKEYKNHSEEYKQEQLQKVHENYLYGLVAIQGVIERTDVLGTYLRTNGVNLFTPRDDLDKYVRFIRDSEPEFWLGDGRPRWRDFLKKNRETIRVGTRICLSTKKWYFDVNKDDRWRSGHFRPGNPPSRDCCYSVEAKKGESDPKKYFIPHSASILIYYHPGDVVGWDPYTYKDITRKRRVSWFLYDDEVINMDAITLEECDYYLKSRLDREDYLRILPTLYWIRRVKIRERELEDEFAKMIAGKLEWDVAETRETIQRAIDWWKLKNKWKRAVTTKESTATRMILKRLGGSNASD